MAGTFDAQIRKQSVLGSREIKASANFGYITNGITLDGSKFAAGATVLEGQCLARNTTSGKYEPYADGAASPAVLNGANNITIAAQAVAADTKVEINHNGDIFTITAAQINTILGTSTAANVVDLVKNAANGETTILDAVGTARDNGGKLQVASELSGGGQALTFTIVNTVAADKTALEALFGMASGTTDKGTGAFPEGFDNPVVLDQSITFEKKDDGNNPDVVCGQVLVWGAVWRGQAIGVTDAFVDACRNVRFVTA
jgi:hypothetical protein